MHLAMAHTITSSFISIQPESTIALTSVVSRSVGANLLAGVRGIGSTFVNFCDIYYNIDYNFIIER